MKVKTDFTLNAPRDVIWNLMGERFADIADWSDGIISSSLDGPLAEGSVRTCELKPSSTGLTHIQEKITHFDRDGRSFAFDIITGLPKAMRRVESRWTLQAAGAGKTLAKSQLTIEMAWWMLPMAPMIRAQFRKLLKGFMVEIEQVANREAGSVEPLRAAV